MVKQITTGGTYMENRIFLVKLTALIMAGTLVLTTAMAGQLLTGETGVSSRWGSGWLDLVNPIDFKSKNKLRLTIGGTAKKIKVRLLPKGRSPDTTAGMLPAVFTVPSNRIVELKLQGDRPQIIQISVHGGANPWGKYPLGGGNGPATLESAEIIRP